MSGQGFIVTPVSPAQAKEIWESLKKPSLVVLATHLAEAGTPVSYSTLKNWKFRGWMRKQDQPAVSTLAGREAKVKLKAGMLGITRAEIDAARPDYAAMNDATLITTTARKCLVTANILMDIAEKRGFDLMEIDMRGLGGLVMSLSSLVSAGQNEMDRAAMLAERVMKIGSPSAPATTSVVAEDDPLANALYKFGLKRMELDHQTKVDLTQAPDGSVQ